MTIAQSPAVLQHALKAVTERLACEIARPLPSPPEWSHEEWLIATAVCAMHGISSLLALTLEWSGPIQWQDFLETQLIHTKARHVRLMRLLAQIESRFEQQGVAGIALKGAALHSLQVYAPGERPMADIDLLVKPTQAFETTRILEELGFKQASVSWKEAVFTPITETAPAQLGEGSHNDLKVEVHTRICERLPWKIVDITRSLSPTAERAGMNPYRSTATLMLHLLLHASGAMAFRWLRMINLHDIALLTRKMSAADWIELVQESERGNHLWWIYPPLKLLTAYYPDCVPSEVLLAANAHCQPALRRCYRKRILTDVSSSYLWVSAFPGIEWSRSAADLFTYLYRRIRPDREYLGLRRLAAQQQSASGRDWANLTQWRRILQWLRSRPIRASTLRVINAALAE